jgi:hypothetical protein
MSRTPEEAAARWKANSSACPHCDSESLYFDTGELDSYEGSQKISCNQCNEEWYDIYDLTGFMTGFPDYYLVPVTPLLSDPYATYKKGRAWTT